MSEAVGIYIHIPFCVRKCNYCDFPSYAGMDNLFDAYAEAVCREIVSAGEKFGKHAVDTVFVGGGTPTILPVPGMKQIMSTLNHVFHLEADAEVTLEANPGTVIARNAAAYRTMGFNRISIGLQAAQDHLLQMMGRIHTRELFLKCVDIVKSCGFSNLNADIIFGLPCQTMEDWQETLDLVLQNRLPHISCYSLKIEENTPWYELNEKGSCHSAMMIWKGKCTIMPFRNWRNPVFAITKFPILPYRDLKANTICDIGSESHISGSERPPIPILTMREVPIWKSPQIISGV